MSDSRHPALPSRILVLNGVGGDATATLLSRDAAGLRPVQQAEQAARGADLLPGLLLALLDRAGWSIASIGLIAAVTGPGSFTGLRATLSLAQGIALGTGATLHGVSLDEALRRTLRDRDGEAPAGPLWCVAVARRDRVFLQRAADAAPEAFMLDALPIPAQPVLLAGDASSPVAAALARTGGQVRCSGVVRPDPRAVAAVALDRLAAGQSSPATLPLYVDPPLASVASHARPPPGPLRS